MKRLIGLAAFAASLVASSTMASAATVQLDDVSFSAGSYLYNYGGTLAPTEGIQFGSKLVILDFAGYIDGSILTVPGFLIGSVEATTGGIVLEPSVVDDPTLVNLVFTYVGIPFQTTEAPPGSPYGSIDFSGLTARSIYGNIAISAFATVAVKNEGIGTVGTDVFSTGKVGVPSAVPEPGTWAMLLAGLGLAGIAMRQRRNRELAFS